MKNQSIRCLVLLSILFNMSVGVYAANGLKITQVYDSVAAKKYKEDNKEYSTTLSHLIGQDVPIETPVIVEKKSRFEIAHPDYVIRVGGGSQFSMQHNGVFNFDTGVILVQPTSDHFQLRINTSKVTFKASGLGSFLMETTTNGGCKIIALSEKPTIEIPNQPSRQLNPGNLIFLVPNKNDFGPTVDIDLYTLYKSSTLLHGFNESLKKIEAIRFAAFFQMHEVDGKSNAIVGDAPNDESFNIIVVE